MAESDGGVGRLAVAIGRHPREFVGILMAMAAVLAIFINALFLQHGPHPAPFFAARPQPVHQAPVVLPRPRAAESAAAPATIARSQTQIVGDIQRELNRKGFYDGAVDGIWGAKTDAAARDFAQAAGLKIRSGARRSSVAASVCGAARSSTLRSAASTIADGGSRAASALPTCPVTPVTRMRIC